MHDLQNKTTRTKCSCITHKTNITIYTCTFSWLNSSPIYTVGVIVRVNKNLDANTQKIQNKSTDTKYSWLSYNIELFVQNKVAWFTNPTAFLYLSWKNISIIFTVWVILGLMKNSNAKIQKIRNISTRTKYSCIFYNT